MYALIALVIFFWAPVFLTVVRNILHDTYVWQIKEYRVDRIISYLKYKEDETYRNRSLNLIQIGLLFSTIIFFFAPVNVLLIIPALVFASYVIEALNRVQDIVSKRLRTPKKSIRNFLILSLSSLCLALPVLLPMNFIRNIYTDSPPQSEQNIEVEPVTIQDFLIQKDTQTDESTIPLAIMVLMVSSLLGITVDLASPLIVAIFAMSTEPLAQYKRLKTIKTAKKNVSEHSKFRVIAITGSFGKTTTKEILYEILNGKYKVAKTEKNFNSTVGIAESINKNLKKDAEIFIAEMGAYRKGEIKKSTDLLQPDISIITAIGPQHLSLFGDINKLVAAKYEIIEGLSKDGLAILNGNNQYCLQMAGKTKRRKLLFYTIEEETEIPQAVKATKTKKAPKIQNDLLYALNIKELKQGYRFDLKHQNISYPVQIQLAGRHNISNVLAAIGASLELGMNIKDIIAKIQTTTLPQVYLNWYKGINNSLILDDGYNINPEGFKSALDVIKEKPGQKLVITRGILELGREQQKVYQDLAEKMEGIIDIIISSDSKLLDAVNINTQNIKTFYATTDKQFLQLIETHTHEKDILLLEGALPPTLLNKIVLHN